jgi:hypothetical protein
LPTTEIYAQTLMKVSVAQHLGIAPHEVTNDQFTTLCAALVSDPLDIMELKGCIHVCDFSLLSLSLSLSKLDISDCNLFAEGGKALAAGLIGNQAITELNVSKNSLGMDSDHDGDVSGIIAIADVIGDGALSSLNLAANSLGELVLPEGWSKEDTWGGMPTFKHADGREQKEDPGSKPEGIIAIANAIPDMGALTSLDISNQADEYGNGGLGAEGTKHLAEALKDHP